MYRQGQVRQRPCPVLRSRRAMRVGMPGAGAKRLLGGARQLLRIAWTPVLPERDLEESLQRLFALARMQLAVQRGPYGKTESGRYGSQKGTAPTGGSAHAPRLAHGKMGRKPPEPEHT